MTMQEVAEYLGVAQSSLYALDKVLEPEMRSRGSKMITRLYTYEKVLAHRNLRESRGYAPREAARHGRPRNPSMGDARGSSETLLSNLGYTLTVAEVAAMLGWRPSDVEAEDRLLRPVLINQRRCYDRDKIAALKEVVNIKCGPRPRWSTSQLSEYGKSRPELDYIFAKQGDRCGMCLSVDTTGNTGWNIDHDHITGAVRGILCWTCNSFLGAARDRETGRADCLEAVETMAEKARKYLKSK